MSARITPLRLEAFEQLPKHARRCVFWEVDPSTLQADDHLTDPEFEKEAWLSMVMLEWGSCGQIAVRSRRSAAATRPTTTLGLGDDPCLGYAFYAPPGAVPRARRFPDRAGQRRRRAADVARGGARRTDADGLLPQQPDRARSSRTSSGAACGRSKRSAHRRRLPNCRPPTGVAELRPVVEVLGDCSVDQCVLDADFLQDVGLRRGRAAPRTSRGCAWNSSRGWAGRPRSRRRWNGCWKPRSCSSRSGPGATCRLSELSLSWTRAGLFHRQLVGEQFGERECAGRPVVLAEQIEPLDRGEDAFGDRVAGLRGHQHARGHADW